MDAMDQHFDESDDLVRFIKNRTRKIDSSVISSYSLGHEQMVRDKVALTKYIKFECELLYFVL